jgi:hypothetical protein
MAQDIATLKHEADFAVYESLALRGDISGLKPAEKVRYYTEYCRSLGLNPATQPLIPLTLNGKQTFYVAKGATDQLAKIHNVTRKILSREMLQDAYVVTVRATLPDGREEESIGAVPVAGLKGEAFSNALMKAETKGKRRSTLSILGLGLLDESEIDSIPPAGIAEAPATAFYKNKAEVDAVIQERQTPRISGEQRARLAKLIRELEDRGVARENLKGKMGDIAGGVQNSADLTPAQAGDVIGTFEQWAAHLREAAEANAKVEAEQAGQVETPDTKGVPF